MEAVGSLGSDLGINTKEREKSKFVLEKSSCDAGQRFSQPSELSLVG